MLVISAGTFVARDFLAVEIVGFIRDNPGIPFRGSFLTERQRDGKSMIPVAVGTAFMSVVFFVLASLCVLGVWPDRAHGPRFTPIVLTALFVLGGVFVLLSYLSVRLRAQLTGPPRFVTLAREPVPVTNDAGVRLFSVVAAVAGVICLAGGVRALLG
ncbi:hypothetical protein [Microbacterium sp. B19]|uniref:hypothetical protein n=1 Tax=Microbacterium sp. B19 TaxID=96765 RepID=UPI00034C9FE6|nr:hypothetical protein [Microbacterium sp. B19]